MKKMINFTVGPVQSNDEIRKIGSEQVPYFRTEEFSNVMFENEKLIKKFTNSPDDNKVIFITGSGTASMEAVIMNTLDENDKALIVNGGSFGKRFVSLCKLHNIPFDSIDLEYFEELNEEKLNKYDKKGYTAFIVNLHETTTGILYNLDLISDFCKKNNLFLIVDAISSFLADSIDMKKSGIDVLITGSQKALSCPPGISIIVLSKTAIDKVKNIECKCMYFDLKDALKNAERGQTPFTPAVGILLQINKRLKMIDENGGVMSEIKKTKELSDYFRNNINDLPFEIPSCSLSNAITPIHPLNSNAYDIFLKLKNNYNIWICPNGGDLKNEVFRVGHIGDLEKKDYDILINALKDLNNKKQI